MKAFEAKKTISSRRCVELLRSDAPKEDTTRNAIAARPKAGTRSVEDMKEHHDNASKKGNDAHERRRRRTGQRHGKAFASIFTSPTQHPTSTAIE
uniref:Uncharacterized protein n=1 Tax=Oryza glumipatula TaxID=40148 RepID=A0A0E0AHT0_9ORYZ